MKVRRPRPRGPGRLALRTSAAPGNVNEVQRIAVEESPAKIPILFALRRDPRLSHRSSRSRSARRVAGTRPRSEEAARIAAAEASAAGVRWTFAPMVDIARDPRWGRIAEGAGEDPYLGSAMARARVRGLQGDDSGAPDRVVACAKHWVAYGAAEGGREYNAAEVSERTLREVYFPPFRAALDAGVGTFMTALNTVDGIPATANPFTLGRVLRGEWRFDGLVVSDYKAVEATRRPRDGRRRYRCGPPGPSRRASTWRRRATLFREHGRAAGRPRDGPDVPGRRGRPARAPAQVPPRPLRPSLCRRVTRERCDPARAASTWPRREGSPARSLVLLKNEGGSAPAPTRPALDRRPRPARRRPREPDGPLAGRRQGGRRRHAPGRHQGQRFARSDGKTKVALRQGMRGRRRRGRRHRRGRRAGPRRPDVAIVAVGESLEDERRGVLANLARPDAAASSISSRPFTQRARRPSSC